MHLLIIDQPAGTDEARRRDDHQRQPNENESQPAAGHYGEAVAVLAIPSSAAAMALTVPSTS